MVFKCISHTHILHIWCIQKHTISLCTKPDKFTAGTSAGSVVSGGVIGGGGGGHPAKASMFADRVPGSDESTPGGSGSPDNTSIGTS